MFDLCMSFFISYPKAGVPDCTLDLGHICRYRLNSKHLTKAYGKVDCVPPSASRQPGHVYGAVHIWMHAVWPILTSCLPDSGPDSDFLLYLLTGNYELGSAPTTKDAQAISDQLYAEFVSEDADKVEIIYSKFVSLITSNPTVQTMLPLTPEVWALHCSCHNENVSLHQLFQEFCTGLSCLHD